MDKVRCPNCRGAKKVAKLGGMIGDCNTCEGSGQINACDRVKPVAPVHDVATSELIDAVSDCVPASAVNLTPSDKVAINSVSLGEPVAVVEHKASIETLPRPAVKVDPKKALYKRKKA